MKKSFNVFATLLLTSLLFVGLTSCEPSESSDLSTSSDPSTSSSDDEPIEEVSILTGWQDNLDSVYDPVVTEGVLHMNFDKAGATWATAKKGLAAIAPDLDDMATLGFDLVMEDYTNVGPMILLLKIEFNDVANNPAKEVKFQASETRTTYEWDVSAFDLTDALQMLMFIDPGAGATVGDAVFAKFAFSKTHAVESPVIIGVPVDVVKNAYSTGDTFDFNNNFYDGGDLVYTAETVAGVTTIDYVKYGPEWSNIYNISTGVGSFLYINAKITGPVDKTALLKVEGGEGPALEKAITFTGEEQDVTLDFGLKQTKTGDQKFLIFAEQGSTLVSSGQISISLLEFSNTALVVEIDNNNYYLGMNPWDKDWVINKFVDGGDGVYAVAGNVISWESGTVGTWTSAKALLGDGNRGFFTKFEITITAAQPMKVKAKIGAPLNMESDLIFAVGDLTQTASIDLSGKTYDEINGVNEILFFILYDAANPVTGSLTVDNAKFTAPRAAAINVNAASNLYGPTSYSIAVSATQTVVSWESKGEWEAFGMALDPTVNYASVTSIEVVVEADTIDELKVKLNDAQEYNLALTDASPQTVTLTVTTPIDAAAKPFMIFFPDGGSTVAGNITISSLKLIVA